MALLGPTLNIGKRTFQMVYFMRKRCFLQIYIEVKSGED